MTITERFYKATEQLWNDFYNHPFVAGICDGTLEWEKFCHYIEQDTLYIKEYSRTFLIGASKADNPDVIAFLANCGLGMVANDEDINKRYLQLMGRSLDDVYSTDMSLDNLSYVSFMERVAYEGGPAEALAAVMPCGLSYLDLADRMVEENPECVNNEKYGMFIKNYTRDSFREYVGVMINTINELTLDYSEEKLEKLVEIYRRSAEYEMRFWDLSWNMN